MKRLQGWEGRLDSVIAGYLAAPFEWGQSDCLTFMADVIRALAGIDILEGHRGAYASEDEAMAMLAGVTGGSYLPAFADMAPVRPNFAQRGDVGIYVLNGLDHCVAVGMDARFFLIRPVEGGLRRLPVAADNLKLWRIE